jgi:hypothetical protein
MNEQDQREEVVLSHAAIRRRYAHYLDQTCAHDPNCGGA